MDFTYIVLGLISGYFSACMGISAGCFLVPLLLFSGLDFNTALSASVMAILISSISSMLLYGKFDYSPRWIMIVPAAIAAIIGEFFIIKYVPHVILRILYAGVMFWSADLLTKSIKKLDQQHKKKPGSAHPHSHKSHFILFILSGITAGLMASILGLGAAIVVTPLLITRADLPYEEAIVIAVKLTIVSCIFALGTEIVTYTLPYLIGTLVSLGAVVGAFFGILTRKHIKQVVVAKATYFTSLFFGFAMLWLALVSSL